MAQSNVEKYLEERKKKQVSGGSFGDADKVNKYLEEREKRISSSESLTEQREKDIETGRKAQGEREARYQAAREEANARKMTLSSFNGMIGGAEQRYNPLARQAPATMPSFVKPLTDVQSYRDALNALPGMQTQRAAAPATEIAGNQSYKDALNALIRQDDARIAAEAQEQAFDVGKYLKSNLMAGWAGIGSGIMKSVNAAVEPLRDAAVDAVTGLGKMGWGPRMPQGTADLLKSDRALGPVYDWAVDPYEKAAAWAEYESQKGGQWAELGGQVIQGVVSNLPNVLLALMTGGGSVVGNQLAKGVGSQAMGGFGKVVIEQAKKAATNPALHSSLVQMYGQRWEDARAGGADAYAATLAASITTLMNAVVEAGGGIEDLPFRPGNVFEWVKSSLEEGGEEVVQQVIDQLGQKAYVNKAIPWFSTTDREAVINPFAAAENMLVGSMAGALMSAPQTVANAVTGANVQEEESFPKGILPYTSKMGIEILQDQNMLGLEEAKDKNGERTWGNFPRFTPEEQAAMQEEKRRQQQAAGQVQQPAGNDTSAISEADTIPAEGKIEAPTRTVSPAIAQMAQEYGEDASIFASNYNGSAPEQYKRGFDAMFNAGKSGLSLEMLGGVSDQLTKGMSEVTKQSIYAAGRNRAANTITPGVQRLTTKKLDSNQRMFVRVWDAIGKEYGLEIDVVDSIKDSNAVYRKGGRRIVVALDAAEGAYVQAAAHEAVHYIRSMDANGYEVLKDVVLKHLTGEDARFDLDTAISERMAQYAKHNRSLTEDDAIEEIVAEAVPTFFGDKEAVKAFVKENRTLAEKIRDFFVEFANKVREIAERYMVSQDRAEIAEILDKTEALKEIAQTFDLALRSAQEKQGTAKSDGEVMTARKRSEGADSAWNREEARLNEAGLATSDDGEVVYPADQDVLYSLRTLPETDYIKERDKAAAALGKRLSITIEEAQRYIDNLTSISAIVAADRIRLDFEAEGAYGAVKPNSDYKWTVDFSTLCKKRLLYTGTFDAIQNRLADAVLTENDYIRLRDMMAKKGYEVACAFCYVESRRKDNGRIIAEFLKVYREAQQGNGVMELGAKGRKKTFRTERGFDPVIANFNTSDGFTDILHNHRGVYDAYMYFMNARGVSKPKLIESRTDYTQEILSKFKSPVAVKAMNRRGGLRLQSFSDFEVVNLLDMMQVVTDMARVGLMSQAYTKVPEFARVFGGTGVKINLSLVTKGVDKNDKLIFDDVEGMPHEEAFRIREMYGENVGTVLVGKDDATIRAAMKDPRIDYIIPFHASGWSLANQAALGIEGYENYTKGQLETSIETGKTVKKQYYPADYWDETKTGDENAQIYLDMCRESGRNPKFPKFAGESGYWKMLIDFRMYDNDGNYAPQRPVRPDVNMDEARRVLDEYRGGHNKLPVAKDVVREFLTEYRGEDDGDIRFSLKSTSYPTASEAQEAAEANRAQTQTEAFKEWFDGSVVVNEDGSPKIMYHGTSKSGFNWFRTQEGRYGLMGMGAYFTENPEVAQGYTRKGRGKTPGVYPVYLAIKNPIDMDAKAGGLAAKWQEFFGEELDGRQLDGDMTNEEILRIVEDALMDAEVPDYEAYDYFSQFYEGNDIDGITHMGGGRWGNGPRHRVYIALSGYQVKSATGNQGEFSGDEIDIRLSLKKDADAENAPEADQNMRLPADVKVDSESIRRQAVTAMQVGLRAKLDQQIKSVAARILKDTGSGFKRDELTGELRALVTEYSRHGLSEDSVQAVNELAQEIIGKGATLTEQDADTAAGELALRIQGDVMGMIGAKNAAQELYGSAQRMRERFRKEYEAQLSEQKKARVAEFQRIAGELKAAKEKGDAEAQKKIMNEYRTALRNVDRETSEAVAKAASAVAQAQAKARAEKMEETREAAKMREKVMKRANELQRMLMGKEKGKRVPSVLQGLVIDVLESLDINGERKAAAGEETQKTQRFNEKLSGIRAFYEEVMDSQSKGESPEGLDGLMMTISERNMDAIRSDIDALGKGGVVALRDMNSEQLKSLNDLLKEVKHTVESIGKLWRIQRYESIIQLGDASISEMDSRGPQKITNKAAGAARDFFALDNMEPVSYGERLGEAGAAVIQSLMDGEKIKFGKVREASKATEKMLKEIGIRGYDIGKWRKRVQVVTLGGKDVRMTDAMLMSLYLTAKRPQGRQHLLANGMRIPTTDRTGAQVKTILLTEGDLTHAASLLTDKQRALADRMGKYLSTAVAKWGNDVTQRMYLYDAFAEANYWPITSDPNVLKTQEPEGERAFNAIVNAGFTKPVNQKATNAVIVMDAFDVFGNHIGEMASYAGYAEALTDALGWLNYKVRNSETKLVEGSVKESMERLLGKGGIQYLTNLVQDINGARRGGDNMHLGWLMGNYKKAAVMGKIRVAIQQPTSIVRAAAEINPWYLIKAMRPTKGLPKGKSIGEWLRSNGTVEEMQKWSNLAWWKSNGNYDIGIGKGTDAILWGDTSIKDTVMEKIATQGGLVDPGKMDDLTWAHMWLAVKEEVRRKRSDLEVGSDEYFRAVAERFEYVMDRTQVVDTVMHRSQMMRGKDGLVKSLTSFMSEPTKSFNMLMRAVMNLGRNPKDAAAYRKLTRTTLAYVASAAATAAATALVDAFRYRDDEEKTLDYLIKGEFGRDWAEQWLKGFMSNVNVADNIPGVSTVIGAFKGEEATIMGFDTFADIKTAFDKLMNYFRGGNTKKLTLYGAVAPMVKAVSEAFGLPFAGIMTNVETLGRIFDPKWAQSKSELHSMEAAYQALYKAMRDGDKQKVLSIRTELARGLYGAEPKSPKQIDTGIAHELARQDERVMKAYEMKLAGNQTDKLVATRKAIMADGFTEAQVNAAINYCETLMKGETTSGEKDMNEQLEASLFKKADLFSAMRSGDSDDVMAVMDYLLENSEAADPEKSLKSAITEEFKQEYINLVSSGRTSEAQKLAKTLQGLGLYATDGKTNYYSDKKLAEWVEDWEKAQEED